MIYTLLIFFCILITFVILSINSFYDYQLNEVVGARKENRLIQVGYNETLNNYLDTPTFENYYYVFDIKSTVGEIPIEIDTYSLAKDDKQINQNEVAISKNIIKDNYNLNDNITITINNKKYTFKIVEITDDNFKRVYLNYNDILKLDISDEIKPSYINILVKQYKNVSNVIEKLNNNGINANLLDSSFQAEINELRKIQTISFNFSIFLFAILLVILFYIIKDIFNNEEKNIAILKILGYKVSYIVNILYARLSIILSITFITLFILFFIGIYLYSFVNKLYCFFLLQKFLIYNLFMILIINLFIILFIVSYVKKIKKFNTIKILNDY